MGKCYVSSVVLKASFISNIILTFIMFLESEFIVMVGLLTMFSIVAIILKTLQSRIFNI